MIIEKPYPIGGGCTCRSLRYRMMTKPMFVHCCHCTWCQRETGTAFALNAMLGVAALLGIRVRGSMDARLPCPEIGP